MTNAGVVSSPIRWYKIQFPVMEICIVDLYLIIMQNKCETIRNNYKNTSIHILFE